MISFLCNIYRKFLDAFLIVFIICSGIAGFAILAQDNVGLGVVGLILGAAIAFVIELLLVPPKMIMFSLDDRVAEIENKISEKSE